MLQRTLTGVTDKSLTRRAVREESGKLLENHWGWGFIFVCLVFFLRHNSLNLSIRLPVKLFPVIPVFLKTYQEPR